MSVVYIAGKIAGDPDYKKKFAAAAEALEAMGLIVLNPAVLPGGMKPGDYMRICTAMMESADAVIFLPDWEQSGGALLERSWCRYTQKYIFPYNDFVRTFSGVSGKQRKSTV